MKLTTNNFDDAIQESHLPILIDFWASWCVPCKMLTQELETFSLRNADKVVIGKVNVDEEPELAEKYKIKGIPTLMLYDRGRLIRTAAGYHTAEELEKKFLPYCES